ncbi:hypothetical protein PV327_007925 [Microctonus hyperodae]|uniref:Uncharacterized protein n=1 Tax=Microctonus hyperodae TaxID=165561 RepID=A0AA39G0G9_MICHY|nr:hypothetical protein PV327_007925 [Microctonus hyperodae]
MTRRRSQLRQCVVLRIVAFWSQALALTHKQSPPSRPQSVSPIPRSPQSHQSLQVHVTRSPTPRPSSAHHHSQLHQAQSTGNINSGITGIHQSQHSHQQQQQVPQSYSIHHNRHPKQEIDSTSPKPEGFDLSKSASVAGE